MQSHSRSFPYPISPLTMSSHRRGAWQDDRPTLPPIRDLFRDELSRSSRAHNHADSPPFSFSRLRVDDDDVDHGRPLLLHPPFGSQPSSSRTFLSPTSPSRPMFPHLSPRVTMSNVSPFPGHLKSRSYPETPNRRDRPFNDSDHTVPYRCNSFDSREPRYYPPGAVDRHLSDNRYDSRTSVYYSQDQYMSNARAPSGPEGTMFMSPGRVDPRGPPINDQRTSTGYSGTVGHSVPTRSDYPGLDATNTSSTSKYDCNYCGKGFNRPSSLKIHLNSHTGEKPFVCPFENCGRGFSVLSNMRRHARRHTQRPHNESSDEGSDNAASAPKSRHGVQDGNASSSLHHNTEDTSRPEKRMRQHSK